MAHAIAEIKGMSATSQTKLAAAQITTVEQLLEHGATAQQRTALAKQLGVSASELTEWINHADLMRW
jgi:uncharacterized protein DUF4332